MSTPIPQTWSLMDAEASLDPAVIELKGRILSKLSWRHGIRLRSAKKSPAP
jgi:hypothetical protein